MSISIHFPHVSFLGQALKNAAAELRCLIKCLPYLSGSAASCSATAAASSRHFMLSPRKKEKKSGVKPSCRFYMLLLIPSIVHDPPSQTPRHLPFFPQHHQPCLLESWTCDWWRRPGCVVIVPAPIHLRTWALYSASHLRRGQFLHFQTRLRGGKN